MFISYTKNYESNSIKIWELKKKMKKTKSRTKKIYYFINSKNHFFFKFSIFDHLTSDK